MPTTFIDADLMLPQASDARSTARVMKAIVQLCFDLQQWDLLNEHILLLTKKRSQLKTVSAEMFALG